MSHVAPMRALDRPRPMVSVERRADGSLVLCAGRTLAENLPLMIDWLERAALLRPDVTFLAERRGPARAWQHLSYAEAWAKTGAIASWLIAQGFGPGAAPVAILSDNSLTCDLSAGTAPRRICGGSAAQGSPYIRMLLPSGRLSSSRRI